MASKKTGKQGSKGEITAFASASSSDLKQYRAAKSEWSQRLLTPSATPFSALSAAASSKPSDNVVGVGIGEKIVNGVHTGIMAVKFLVRIKYDETQLAGKDRLPKTVNGLPTDVEQVGTFRRLAAASQPMPNPRTKIRPAQPGCSIGFKDPGNQFIMAGTFGAVVKSGQKQFILSNNHVLAHENKLPIGSSIFQPGFLDAGNPPNNDVIARLSKFVTIKTGVINKVDCAIAQVVSNSLVSKSVLFIGPPTGRTNALLDMIVHKFGRTTGYRVGRVTSIDTDVKVQYDIGLVTFGGQIIIKGLNNQQFSAAGDSGSLILERATNRAVGLLFAGSATDTIANHIGDVLQALNVQLA
jgi:hypothetical protein